MEFKIFTLEDLNRLGEVCKLFATGLTETTEEWWIWKHYTENGLPKGRVVVAENKKGELCAVFAMQPAYYTKGDTTILLVQLEDLVISPECRGKGLMRKLYQKVVEYYSKRNAAALIGLSPNNLSYPILINYGAKDIKNLSGISSKKRLFRWNKDISSLSNGEWKFIVESNMPEELFFTKSEEVWKMNKNQRFMEWKFKENPEQEYRWLKIVNQGELGGYIVFYVNKGRVRSAVNICDWDLKPCVDEILLRHAVKILKSYGNWISLWGSMSAKDKEKWVNAGLTEVNEENAPFVYCAVNNENVLDEWHMTKADSDN